MFVCLVVVVVVAVAVVVVVVVVVSVVVVVVVVVVVAAAVIAQDLFQTWVIAIAGYISKLFFLGAFSPPSATI